MAPAMSLPLPVALLLAAANPDEILAKVQDTYKHAGDMQASFVQTHNEKLRKKVRSEEGRLWAKADGRLRWEYDRPAKKYFFFDGKNAFFYEPDNAQVTEFESFADSPLSHALEFLLGRGRLAETFSAGACTKNCDLAASGEVVLELVPKKPLPSVERVLFCIDPKTYRVRQTLVFDPLGNRTDYVFTDVVFGSKIVDERFTFNIPEGVNRLRAALDGTADAPPDKNKKAKPSDSGER